MARLTREELSAALKRVEVPTKGKGQPRVPSPDFPSAGPSELPLIANLSLATSWRAAEETAFGLKYPETRTDEADFYLRRPPGGSFTHYLYYRPHDQHSAEEIWAGVRSSEPGMAADTRSAFVHRLKPFFGRSNGEAVGLLGSDELIAAIALKPRLGEPDDCDAEGLVYRGRSSNISGAVLKVGLSEEGICCWVMLART
jgi:hypothetical protein